MSESKTNMVVIVCALMCEARPVIDYYRLKKSLDKPFTVFANDNSPVLVAVSGIGVSGSAAAVGWLSSYLATKRSCSNPVWLNVGSAGHGTRAIGEIVRINRYAMENGRASFVPLIAKWPGESESLVTSAAPSSDYPQGSLVDMEGEGFFKAALHFSKPELVQSIKVVSDNAQQGFDRLSAAKITELIQQNVAQIVDYIEQLRLLSHVLPSAELRQESSQEFGEHWTHSQRQVAMAMLESAHALGLKGEADHILKTQQDYPQAYTSLSNLLSGAVPQLMATDQNENAHAESVVSQQHGRR